MSVRVRHYNETILHITSGLARYEQIDGAFKAVFNQIRKSYPNTGYEKAHYIVNIVCDVKGNLFGYAYVWVSDARIYNMLVGRNPEGTERVKEYADPKWIPPANERPIMPFKPGQSWADMDDEENELDEKYTAPIIREVLPPLVRLPGYKYDEEQLAKAQEILQSKAGATEKITVPKIGYFEVSRAWVSDPDSNESKFTLCCRTAPTWVSEDILRPIFERYSSDKEIRFGTVKGTKQNFTYPVISIVQNKDSPNGSRFPSKFVYINYSKLCPTDASFALIMNRKFKIQNHQDIANNETRRSRGQTINPVREAVLIFSRWYEHCEKVPYNKATPAPVIVHENKVK